MPRLQGHRGAGQSGNAINQRFPSGQATTSIKGTNQASERHQSKVPIRVKNVFNQGFPETPSIKGSNLIRNAIIQRATRTGKAIYQRRQSCHVAPSIKKANKVSRRHQLKELVNSENDCFSRNEINKGACACLTVPLNP